MVSCPNCPGSEIEYDSALGSSICTSCGNVCSQNDIISEVTFGENAQGGAILHGTFVAAGSTRAVTSGSSRVRMYSDSRDVTLMKANETARRIACSLNINDFTVERALRFFKIALTNQFTRGRKSDVTIAACLYTACRDQKSPHMLIDFADAIQTSVFAIGSTFLKLSLLFPTDNIPLVDPSLYISRFASKLGFGNKTGRVITDASRLVSRMKADWIEYGRRPAGICGACLLIAARMNHFQRSLKDIMYVVKMSPETIRRRLIEFASTASGNLTIGDFRSTWLEQSANPPAFSQNNTENTEKEIEMLENSTAKEIKEFYESRKELISLEVKKATEAFAEAADPEIDRFDPNLEELQKDSDMEDELDQFILTEEEVEAKTMVWTQENKTYLEEQENKRKARESEEQNEANKRARKPNRKAPIINTTDPAEATLQLLNHKNITNVNKPGIQGLFQIPKLPNIDQEAAPL